MWGMTVVDAFLEKGPPPHPLSKTFREDQNRVVFLPIPSAGQFKIIFRQREATVNRRTRRRFFTPPSGREGDREAVEGASGYKSKKSCIVASGYAICPYEKRRNIQPQAPPCPLAANFTHRRRISPSNCRGRLHFVDEVCPFRINSGREAICNKRPLSRPL